MLVNGYSHTAILTGDSERFVAFYQEVFGAEVYATTATSKGGKVTFIRVGPTAEINLFELPDNHEHEHQTPMFGRGRIDHVALQAATMEDFEEVRRRLMERGASDDFVSDFGNILSVFFRDPDGLEGEVCIPNPDVIPGYMPPVGTRAKRFPPA